MSDLAGQRVLVTGAANGLGAALARAFAEAGAELVLMDRDALALDAVARDLGAEARALDLADADALGAALEGVRPVSTLIHNAGLLRPAPIEGTDLALFDATMNVGIRAGFQLARWAWRAMREAGGGALVFVSSQSGIRGFADETAYCAAKHALEGLSKCLAIEGAPHGILSCTITPGRAMRTPMSEANYPEELKAEWIDPIGLAPAFLSIAAGREMGLSGQRLNAWEMSQETGRA